MPDRAFVIISPSERRTVVGKFAGTVRQMICDSETPTDHLVTGIVQVIDPGGRIPLHHHHIEEFQFIVSGTGIARDAQGNEYLISEGTSIYCRPGPEGAHEYENTGADSLKILFVFPSRGGTFPEVIDGAGA